MKKRKRGYFGIGVYHPKTRENIGSLLRTAYQLNAAFVFTIGRRYKMQASDTTKTSRHTPLYHYTDIDGLLSNIPHSCPIVGVEMGGEMLRTFTHPVRAIYLLGAEDHGLPTRIMAMCHHIVSLDAVCMPSYNVAVAGSIVAYHREFLS